MGVCYAVLVRTRAIMGQGLTGTQRVCCKMICVCHPTCPQTRQHDRYDVEYTHGTRVIGNRKREPVQMALQVAVLSSANMITDEWRRAYRPVQMALAVGTHAQTHKPRQLEWTDTQQRPRTHTQGVWCVSEHTAQQRRQRRLTEETHRR